MEYYITLKLSMKILSQNYNHGNVFILSELVPKRIQSDLQNQVNSNSEKIKAKGK